MFDVCLSVAYIGPKSRIERHWHRDNPRHTHVTRDSDTTFKVRRSKVNLQGAKAYCGDLLRHLISAYTVRPLCCIQYSTGYLCIYVFKTILHIVMSCSQFCTFSPFHTRQFIVITTFIIYHSTVYRHLRLIFFDISDTIMPHPRRWGH